MKLLIFLNSGKVFEKKSDNEIDARLQIVKINQNGYFDSSGGFNSNMIWYPPHEIKRIEFENEKR